MQIHVKLFATFRQHMPPHAQEGACEITVPAGARVSDVLSQFDVPLDNPNSLVVLINGRQSDLDQVLGKGDVVSAFPAMAGG